MTYALSLDPKVIGRIDHERGDIPRSRYVERILKEALKDDNRIKNC